MHAWNLSAREPGDPGGAHRLEKAAGRKGNPQGHALHARHREVGPPRSTGEGSEQTPQGERRDWREGGGSRRTQWKNTRTGHRNGMPCHRDYRAFVRQREGTKDYSSQRPSVTSTRDCCWTASIRQPRALHPYPLERFYANIRDKSRVRSQRLHGSVRGRREPASLPRPADCQSAAGFRPAPQRISASYVTRTPAACRRLPALSDGRCC